MSSGLTSSESSDLARILTGDADSRRTTSSLDADVGLDAWTNDDWANLLREGPTAFARALQDAETEMERLQAEPTDTEAEPTERTHASSARTDAGLSPHQRHDSTTVPIVPPAPVSAVETHAFTAWAERIARLHILNVDDEIDSDSLLDHHQPEATAALALSAASERPESQLLRMRILLAQEEARKSDRHHRTRARTRDRGAARSPKRARG